jgi:hypothetical protein
MVIKAMMFLVLFHEYLIGMFAANAGKKKRVLYTSLKGAMKKNAQRHRQLS